MLIDPAVPVPDWPLSARGLERMQAALRLPWVAGLEAVWSSTERKARDGAAIVASHVGLPLRILAELGENDRSATGYLPSAEFEATADAFFARPHESVRGWERAVDAQRRILGAVRDVVERSGNGDLAVVAHGGVGTVLLCHLQNVPISRMHDQPRNNGGNYFAFEAETGALVHGWRPLDG